MEADRDRVVPGKACPVVLRRRNGRLELLAFRHPLAGLQIVKGGVEAGESLGTACERELAEEAGIAGVAGRRLGTWLPPEGPPAWGFHAMDLAEALPDSWEFLTRDDGGHRFRFFWQPLDEPTGPGWHPVFAGAIDWIRATLATHRGT